jgi:glycosyltransferase involved in cell wall biosynthesis
MKVLQIVSGRKVNGAVTYGKFLTERLLSRSYDVTIMHRSESWLGEQSIPGAKFFLSEMSRTPRELKRVSQWICEQKFDLIHTHMSRAHFMGVLLRMISGVPVVATAHSCTFQLHWMLNDYVIANSQATLNYQRRFNWVRASRSEKIFCFSSLARFQNVNPERVSAIRQHLKVGPDDFLVGVVGQVGQRKGQKYLFDGLPALFQRIPNLKVALVGEFERTNPYIKRLRRQHLQNGWHGRVRWLGRRNNVEDYMHAIDLCVVPSEREPLGLVALEALASGTPVVATRTGGLPEIVIHNENGLLVPRKNTPALLAAIEQLAAEPEMRSTMGERGRKMVLEKFSPDLLTDQVIDVYNRVLGARSTKSRSADPVKTKPRRAA